VVARHLLDLRSLSVRGCVRVTGQGVEAIVEGCELLTDFDVSQCRNLTTWVDAGGREDICRRTGRDIKFSIFSGDPGSWKPMSEVVLEAEPESFGTSSIGKGGVNAMSGGMANSIAGVGGGMSIDTASSVEASESESDVDSESMAL
jgi:hypothetical protein